MVVRGSHMAQNAVDSVLRRLVCGLIAEFFFSRSSLILKRCHVSTGSKTASQNVCARLGACQGTTWSLGACFQDNSLHAKRRSQQLGSTVLPRQGHVVPTCLDGNNHSLLTYASLAPNGILPDLPSLTTLKQKEYLTHQIKAAAARRITS
jgi:hypothetical protein